MGLRGLLWGYAFLGVDEGLSSVLVCSTAGFHKGFRISVRLGKSHDQLGRSGFEDS